MNICAACKVSKIAHARKALCAACYTTYRKQQWTLNDSKRKLNPSFVIKRKEYKARYFQQNKEHLLKKNSKYQSQRLKTDTNFLLRKNLRRRLSEALKNNQKTGSAVSDLGCSINELKVYLEYKFLPGMTWDNYGKWHIDHIKPLSSFDLTDPQQFKEACHYTNLQPLWAKDNLSKGGKYES